MSETMRVTFWGVRGSFPVPGPDTVRFGGNTPCVEVQANGHTIILDAGTGIVRLGNDLLRRAKEKSEPVRATLLFSHMHHDHTQGFPYFPPAYIGTSVLYILGPRTFEEDLDSTLSHAVLPPSFPVSLAEMPSLKVIRSLRETETVLLDGELSEPQVCNIYRDIIPVGPDTVRVHIHKSFAHPRTGAAWCTQKKGPTAFAIGPASVGRESTNSSRRRPPGATPCTPRCSACLPP